MRTKPDRSNSIPTKLYYTFPISIILLLSLAMISAVIFDLYGTLVELKTDSRPYHVIARSIDSKNYRQLIDKALKQDYQSLGDWAFDCGFEGQLDIESLSHSLNKDLESAQIFNDVDRNLQKLKSEGVKLGLISNLASPYAAPVETFGLTKYFDAINYSFASGLTKPDARIYELMLEKLSLNETQVLMVGDSLRCDVNGPRSVGIKSLHLNRVTKGGDTSINTLDSLIDDVV